MAEKVREFDAELSLKLDLAIVMDEERGGIWHDFKAFIESLIFGKSGEEDEQGNKVQLQN